ncbi:hypothetical protein EO98_09235 [Methanosarcina sp. 2.H.T.1A.6]|nr:hypothetical protein EO94_15625 [Methanosarcina sp. 2.H.T.1A.3]KKG19637.1 hypothetical protein EO98_09235 [Methanosarcina sp. 2.H.T.1A.6]KKG22140.1 hypothetical protein EO97_17390 [Methanosarcina sp. 2.H.T.1A.15]KKG26788.1 hypothetical protein EO96_02500 [Methanosarcina sp. 2.H.T.1A.8]
MNKKSLMYFCALFFLFLVILLIFTMQEEDGPSGFETVNVDEARELIEMGDIFVLDVRTPAEFNESHIEGATLIPVTNSGGSNLSPDQLLEARISEVPKGKKILVYCRSGRRSADASQILVDASYTGVYNMGGGINEWIAAGYPVVS